MRDQTIIDKFKKIDSQLNTLMEVLKNIVGKELMRAQALHKVLMDKGLFNDTDLKKALEDMIAEAKVDLEKEAKVVEDAKTKAVEILVPNTVQANSNTDMPSKPDGE